MENTATNPELIELRKSILNSGNYVYGGNKSGRIAKTKEHEVAVEAFKLKLDERYECDVTSSFKKRHTQAYLSRFCEKDGIIRKYRTVHNIEEGKFTIIRIV